MTSFGIKTAPMHVSYDDILRVWREADSLPVIEHAWLWDHLLPLAGPADGLAFEGWTLLAALAARTERLELGLMVTSNRIRPPAVLAKIAATVDTVAAGRDPGEIIRSVQTHVNYEDPDQTVRAVAALNRIGVTHIVLNLPRPYPVGVVSWVVRHIRERV